jgi:hypothetical protein
MKRVKTLLTVFALLAAGFAFTGGAVAQDKDKAPEKAAAETKAEPAKDAPKADAKKEDAKPAAKAEEKRKPSRPRPPTRVTWPGC